MSTSLLAVQDMHFQVVQAELIGAMASQAAATAVQQGRDELAYDDVAQCVAGTPALDFLRDIVPKKVTVAQALGRNNA